MKSTFRLRMEGLMKIFKEDVPNLDGFVVDEHGRFSIEESGTQRYCNLTGEDAVKLLLEALTGKEFQLSETDGSTHHGTRVVKVYRKNQVNY